VIDPGGRLVGAARLRDRLREVVRVPAPSSHPASAAVSFDSRRPSDEVVEETLGGSWQPREGGRSFLVTRRIAGTVRHGRSTVADLSARLARAAGAAALLTGGATSVPFVFFDLETTGLSGGAGTYVFLIGCGCFDAGGGFVTEQHLLIEPESERLMLQTVAEALSRAGALVSFNGKSFDAPVLDTRYLYHRLEPVCSALPHVDVLHPARRFWGDGGAVAGPSQVSCSLTVLERQILGARRPADVPGFEIPSRYFQFVRSGDVRLLSSILEHNRRDLLSLAGLTSRLFHMLESGPAEAASAREALGLGRVYLRAGLDERAREALTRSVGMSRAPQGVFDPTRIEGLRALALAWRRARRFDEAAECWRQLIETRGCPATVMREATEALAIHHEHRLHDLFGAKEFALRSLENGEGPLWTDSIRHRLDRIERKLEAVAPAAWLDLD
jgi:uncharacterized protein YprB with RNaseH-like and TPR domain